MTPSLVGLWTASATPTGMVRRLCRRSSVLVHHTRRDVLEWSLREVAAVVEWIRILIDAPHHLAAAAAHKRQYSLLNVLLGVP